jgi:hypothetical protein
VHGGGAALKGCAARTGKPALALDRDTDAVRVAMMPLRKIASGDRFPVDDNPEPGRISLSSSVRTSASYCGQSYTKWSVRDSL